MSSWVLNSTRRVFWERVGAGDNAGAAGVAVGVSVFTGRRWFRDAGGVKPQFSKANSAGCRPRLTLAERIDIHAGIHGGESLRSIAKRLGRSPSTIKRELDANVRNRYDGRKSGYRRKQAFGARQSGNIAAVRYDALAAQRSADCHSRT